VKVVDSSAWLEVLIEAPRARRFQQLIEEAEGVLVPTIVVYEVFKFLQREESLDTAERAAALLKTYHIVPLDDRLAMEAADFSLRHGLPMADAIVYATAVAHNATVVTGDEHFAELEGVEFVGAGEQDE